MPNHAGTISCWYSVIRSGNFIVLKVWGLAYARSGSQHYATRVRISWSVNCIHSILYIVNSNRCMALSSSRTFRWHRRHFYPYTHIRRLRVWQTYFQPHSLHQRHPSHNPFALGRRRHNDTPLDDVDTMTRTHTHIISSANRHILFDRCECTQSVHKCLPPIVYVCDWR